MGSYFWTCPECGKTIDLSTTRTYDISDEIECPFCGRISIISDTEIQLKVKATGRKVSPTKMEELEKFKESFERKNIRNINKDLPSSMKLIG